MAPNLIGLFYRKLALKTLSMEFVRQKLMRRRSLSRRAFQPVRVWRVMKPLFIFGRLRLQQKSILLRLLSGERHNDFTTHVVHKERDCETRQIHKGVARDRGRNVFQGKFEVERKAQKTDAKMTANALLLSGDAEANHKPELEIYADDGGVRSWLYIGRA